MPGIVTKGTYCHNKVNNYKNQTTVCPAVTISRSLESGLPLLNSPYHEPDRSVAFSTLKIKSPNPQTYSVSVDQSVYKVGQCEPLQRSAQLYGLTIVMVPL